MKAQGAAVGIFSQGPGLWPQLPAIKNSMLIINGLDDRITPVDNAKQIAALIPGAWLTLFKDAGHAVLFQESDGVAALVHAFLMKK